MKYLIDSLQSYETGHGDALCPIQREADEWFMGEHRGSQPVTQRDLDMKLDGLATRISNAIEQSKARSYQDICVQQAQERLYLSGVGQNNQWSGARERVTSVSHTAASQPGQGSAVQNYYHTENFQRAGDGGTPPQYWPTGNHSSRVGVPYIDGPPSFPVHTFAQGNGYQTNALHPSFSSNLPIQPQIQRPVPTPCVTLPRIKKGPEAWLEAVRHYEEIIIPNPGIVKAFPQLCGQRKMIADEFNR